MGLWSMFWFKSFRNFLRKIVIFCTFDHWSEILSLSAGRPKSQDACPAMVGRSQVMRQWQSLVLYKSFNTDRKSPSCITTELYIYEQDLRFQKVSIYSSTPWKRFFRCSSFQVSVRKNKDLRWDEIYSRMVRASDSQCRSRNCPGFDPSILRHSVNWGAEYEAGLNTVKFRHNKKTTPGLRIRSFCNILSH